MLLRNFLLILNMMKININSKIMNYICNTNVFVIVGF